jgi:signal transduction histidine kinase
MPPSIERITHQIVCLRTISRLLSESSRDPVEIMNTLVHLLPEGWQYPSATCVRVIWDDKEICSANFNETEWVQSAKIIAGKHSVGELEVYYLEEKPKADEGPFLTEERHFIDTVAVELGRYLELKQAERLKDQLYQELELYSSLLRHDLKNDLGVIMGNVEIAKMTIADRDEIFDEILASTEAVCERMLSLLKAFGDAAKMADTDPLIMIEKIADQAMTASMGMKVEVSVEDDARDGRMPASKLLPLVFDNLLRNAAVHAGNAPNVKITLSRVNGFLKVIVADDGPGIAPEIQDKLFQKGASTSGGGLGLYLSRQIVETMGGIIQLIDSDSKMGATFEVLLPTTH